MFKENTRRLGTTYIMSLKWKRVTTMMVEWELKNVVNGMNVKNSDTNEEENFVKC